MTDNDNVSRSARTLPCGHQHKPGTRFCTVCGVPVPAQISAQDAFGATQTVQARDNLAMPGGGFGGPVADLDDTSAATRLRPRVPRESDPSWQAEPPRSWQPGEDWQPGPEWQQPQQQWQQPQQQWQPSQDWQQPAQPWQAQQQAQQSATPWDQQGGQWQQPAAPWEQQPQWGQSGGQWQQSRPTGQSSNAFPAAPPATGGRSRMPVIAGIVLAAVLLGGGTGSYLLLAHHNPPAANASNSGTLPPTSPATTPLATTTTTTAPPTTTPPTTPATGEQQAATNLANLLQQSVSDRNAINQAYNDVLNCGSLLGQDQQTFQQAASSRQSLISQISSLPGAAALPAQTLSDLTSAWQASATVDQDYAQWAANENSNGCVANDTSNSNYVAAEGPNGQATTSKTAFVSRWNPIAQKYGLTQYSQDQL